MEKTGYTSENLKVLRGLDTIRNRPALSDVASDTYQDDSKDIDYPQYPEADDKTE